ncbi:PASTA domain-containing protein [Paraconexibacter algicola]|uniref:PASTA domain-containing protein n=1 Tax=Paraconexibacter algicola TaxID=2133960 RepID=A0A2T4UFM0_9ACTN|nr:PASTA domain-containing protein [Paraconexibacter algicola]PTL56584.1 hypothetical protein C7Y72_16685 [Paraconexibacter algicola]
MRTTLSRSALAALALSLGLPALAHGAVTATTITSPTGDVRALTLAGTPASFQRAVTGTATAADGDKVDVRCYGSDTNELLAADLVVAGGAFSGTLDLTPIDDDGFPCTARAVPDGDASPGDIGRFAGPRMFISHFAAPAQAGMATPVNGGGTAFIDTYGAYAGPRGTGFSYEPDDDALYELSPVNPTTLFATYEFGGYYPFDTAADIDDRNAANTGSALTVDGHNGYLAPNIPILNYDGMAGSELPTGVASITANASLDAAGTLTMTESYPVYRCADAGGTPNDTHPVTTASCPRTVSAGVRLDRVKRFTNDGASVVLADTFVSTDGAAHDVGLEVDEDNSVSDYVETKAPGDLAFTIRGFGDVLTYTSAPATLLTRDSQYPESSYVGAGARTALEQPVRTTWEDDDESFTLQRIAVPAGASATRTTVYAVSLSSTAAESGANALEDQQGAPTIAIASPAAGSTTTSNVAIVAGTARDNKAVASVKVNGQSVPVASDGSWVAPIALQPGANAIAAVVADGAGNTNQAVSSITYTPPATPQQVQAASVKTCRIPAITRGSTVTSASTKLKKAGCKVATKRRSITSKTKKGRVLSTSPAAGTTILADNPVTLTTSKGRAAKRTKR